MKGMRNIAPFGLRMPEELREEIQKRAKENGRSMNSEIVHILEQHLDTTAAEKITPYLTTSHVRHFSSDGEVIDIKTASDIAKYIDLRTEEYKKEMLEGLLAIARGGIETKPDDDQ